MVAFLATLVFVALQLMVTARVLTRPNRQASARIAWLAVLYALPLLGLIAYVLLGETNIGRTRAERKKTVIATLTRETITHAPEDLAHDVPIAEKYRSLFTLGQSINGFPAVGDNHAELLDDSEAVINAMVADIDAATDHVHLIFYIWLTDVSGLKMIEALKRAAARGVTCRAMVDHLGSRTLVDSQHWADLSAAGVKTALALPLSNPFTYLYDGRLDLRNHRKILVIDNRVTYCGSQNCADAAFSPKPKFAPWVDAVMRFEGPIVRQKQFIFASDWMTYTDEDIRTITITDLPTDPPKDGFPALAIATGPTTRANAMTDMFASIIQVADRELVITTPYYAPDEAMQSALRSAGRRGVATTLILPARNNDFLVAATSRSFYLDLLEAGIVIYEYPLGLLHTKSITVDGEVTLIGSSNMDRRSCDLNYENNILLCDRQTTTAMRARQQTYIDVSRRVTLQEVRQWSFGHRLLNNTVAIASPLL